MSDKRHTFATLDGLRGLAAIAVVLFHLTKESGHPLFGHGYLAVDFFFVLSGFVLTFAYQHRLDSGWSAADFMKVRFARLYPLYLVGFLLGCAFLLLQSRVAHVPFSQPWYVLGLNLCMLPSSRAGQLFPADFAAWSIFFELIANLAHALFFRNRRVGFFLPFLFAGAAAVVTCSLRFGSIDLGYLRASAGWALARVAFSYTAGILLFRFWQSGSLRLKVSPVPVGLLLALSMTMPSFSRFNGIYDAAVCLFLFPLLVLSGASTEPSGRLTRPFQVVGQLSYAIYILQIPLVLLFDRITFHLIHRTLAQTAYSAGLLYLILLIVLAALLDRYYDQWARNRLRRILFHDSRPRKLSSAS